MSTIREDQTKVVLLRGGADEFWQTVHEHYAHEDPLTWKYLAMLALSENAGWPLEYIGLVFSHHKGHVSRCLQKIKHELRSRFQLSPTMTITHDQKPGPRTKLDSGNKPKPSRKEPPHAA